MESLRWILLGLGGLVVIGLYAFAMLKKHSRREPVPSYEEVDWEQDAVESLSDAEEYDDLPSMDALESARALHRAEGNSVASPVEPAFADTQEIPVLQAEQAAAEELPEQAEEAEPGVNLGLRNNLLLGAVAEEPVMGTPISAVELDADQQMPHLNADSLKMPSDSKAEPRLDLDAAQVAAALQRRRQTAAAKEPEVRVKSPMQNAFSFDNEQEARQGKAPAQDLDLAQAANQRLQREAAERVQAKAQALKEERAAAQPEPSPAEEVTEEVIVLHVKSKDSIGFYGPEMAQCFNDIGIKFGEMDIYHYVSGGQRLLSVANMVKPGTFDPDNLSGFTTPGISLFLQLRPDSDFELSEQVLVKSAQYIAYKLKGEVLTQQHEVLDNVRQATLSRNIADIKAAFS